MEELLAERFDRTAPLLAEALIEEFGSLAATLSASPERLARIAGKTASAYITTIQRALLHSLAPQELDRPIIASAHALLSYLHFRLAADGREQVRVLYLDVKHRLIRDEAAASGMVATTTLPVREIIARALELGAGALILVHNHPSGDPEPSKADIKVTAELARIGKSLDIHLIEHIVIGWTGAICMREQGYL